MQPIHLSPQQPRDFRFESELTNLRDKNQYVHGERKRYQISFYSKYSVLAKETGTPSAITQTPSKANGGGGGSQPKQRDTRKKHHRKHIMAQLTEPGKTTVYIIGQRRFDLYRDYLQVETRKVKQNFLSVVDWMCLKN